MRSAVAAALALALAAGCGVGGPPDHTALFVRCLTHGGGRLIDRPSRLDGFPSTDAQLGMAAWLPSVSYYSIDVADGPGDRRQALVFVEDLRPEGTTPMPEPAELLHRARRGAAGVHALVLMPPTDDPAPPIGHCEDVAAPGQAFP